MVGMRMRVEHGVDPADAGAGQLQPQIRRRVDQQALPVIGFDHDARARAAVARLGGVELPPIAEPIGPADLR